VLHVTVPRVAVGPELAEYAEKAIRDGGGEPVAADASADALVWLMPGDMDGLRAALATASSARWVQLPFAGIEKVTAAGLLDPGRTWTSAKGAYAEPVAEHALALALAGLRLLRRRLTARSWGKPGGVSLYDQPVTILGGGGITASLLELLAPMRVNATVVRNRPEPVPGAVRTVGQADLHEALAGALVVFLALALTPSTEHIIGAAELAAMRPDAWLVNVARAAAGRAPALGSRALHHHPAHRGHHGDDHAPARPPYSGQRGPICRGRAPDRPGRPDPRLLDAVTWSGHPARPLARSP
jgi:phosphoglycerate dehydrogenase-like enzyme